MVVDPRVSRKIVSHEFRFGEIHKYRHATILRSQVPRDNSPFKVHTRPNRSRQLPRTYPKIPHACVISMVTLYTHGISRHLRALRRGLDFVGRGKVWRAILALLLLLEPNDGVDGRTKSNHTPDASTDNGTRRVIIRDSRVRRVGRVWRRRGEWTWSIGRSDRWRRILWSKWRIFPRNVTRPV